MLFANLLISRLKIKQLNPKRSLKNKSKTEGMRARSLFFFLDYRARKNKRKIRRDNGVTSRRKDVWYCCLMLSQAINGHVHSSDSVYDCLILFPTNFKQ